MLRGESMTNENPVCPMAMGLCVCTLGSAVTSDATIFCLQYAAGLHNIVYDDCLVRACVVQCASGTVVLKSSRTFFCPLTRRISSFSASWDKLGTTLKVLIRVIQSQLEGMFHLNDKKFKHQHFASLFLVLN